MAKDRPRAELPRAQNGAEPQLLLTSLLGDFWYWRDEHIPAMALVKLLAEFDVSSDGARAAMRRLVARGLLDTSRSGRTTAYGIPARTSEVIVERTHRMLTFGASAPEWDGQWTVVAFSVPEQDRSLRTTLRSRLRVLRFAALYDGVWVSPHDLGTEARRLLGELGIDSATVLRCTAVPGGPKGGDPASAFDLTPLADGYRDFAERYEPLLDSLDAGLISPAEALRTRTELRVAWRSFPETDPDLPAELLPSAWDRPRAQRVFVQIYDRLGPLAEVRFRQILATVAPELAELVSHHDSAAIAALYASLGDRRAHGDTPFEQATQARRLAEAAHAKR
ncbi:PaaX family transcriptional regulator C-terminal domain-containing protein [Streptomyces luomodiensis]|uniref:PaaX family transcriptional regulator C-terminal domain-containing protein n=1 Tax=Streptomyces luomodiensis TaxID=3026192 RepID=A0ABY9URM7_9ACTN|nr:PaaX family transcriptional regulator C-terminal domain-containing protein [Streptomyces sp. SCA4-21]WNE95168.1 PaaX family transcriptional regulator C-terminal domain-containing protein [Streptomyces sp. SCA4-21]